MTSNKRMARTSADIDAMLAEIQLPTGASMLVLDEDDQPVPLWVALPEIPYLSIGWRMGPGEDYWLGWSKWYASLMPAERLQYQTKNPEPKSWNGFYLLKEERL